MRIALKPAFTLTASVIFLLLWAFGQSSVSSSGEIQMQKPIVVPEPAGALLRPILDEVQKGGQRDERRLNDLLYGLTQKNGHGADEALVVLMCFYVGESQEEVDAVIGRGTKMLPLLNKYRDRNPNIPGRSYPESMFKGISSKDNSFKGAIRAIHNGWHSTADNPEG